jgi:hypothetical protein
MRPFRTYLHRFVREHSTLQEHASPGVRPVSELRIRGTGVTPCRARGHAYRELEQQLVRDNLPRQGWRLLTQTLER